VLVPRPETELLVERALALLPPTAAAVADLGTGSGAIALALAVERPLWRLTATDKSAAALDVAAGNARALGLSNVRFVAGDWLQPLQGERYALIASNPPYIGAGEPALGAPALQHEPQLALCSGAGGLDALAVIIAAAPDCLEPQGWLLLEHGAAQGPAVASMLVAQGYAHVRCHTDLAGQPRVTEAQKE
jgi:release factor glutamine methyltransferase